MAKYKVTHIGKFSQQFSYPIPNLKELMIWINALRARVYQIVMVISMTEVKRIRRKYSLMTEAKALPPNP